jgi:hypothetical protein
MPYGSDSIGPTAHYRIVCPGRWCGELVTRVPLAVLRRIARGTGPDAAMAAAELNRRGAVLPAIEITMHAIDRASQSLLGVWRKTRQPGEGLNAWLHRMAAEAVEARRDAHTEKPAKLRSPAGIEFALDWTGKYPLVKTVVRCRPKRARGPAHIMEDEST